jgi:hypothetical protein
VGIHDGTYLPVALSAGRESRAKAFSEGSQQARDLRGVFSGPKKFGQGLAGTRQDAC